MAESTVLGMDIIPFHDVAHIFPMMAAEEFGELLDDIRDHGLHEPIWLHEDQIIDGRNRYNACMEAGVEPEYRVWSGQGSLIQFVVSLNLKRRHLTSSQRAMIALDILPRLEAEARERQLATLKQNTVRELIPERSQDQQRPREVAAEMTNTNPRYVSDAKRIIQEDTTLADRVRAGELSIPAAKAQLPSMIRPLIPVPSIQPTADWRIQTILSEQEPPLIPSHEDIHTTMRSVIDQLPPMPTNGEAFARTLVQIDRCRAIDDDDITTWLDRASVGDWAMCQTIFAHVRAFMDRTETLHQARQGLRIMTR